mmetsp:Transcript_21513/g.43105  ORF Transcript_21513/g.43105 Transcript_21513/m.43105 type:complete len:201 (+) Transcript_21513:368-970(+)
MSSACQPKYLVLILLVVQNTCLVLLMRYSRTRPGTMYLGSTAVCCDEAMKLVTCLSILGFTYYFQSGKGTSGSSDGDGGEEKSKNGMEETTTTDTTNNTRDDFTDDIHHRQHPSNFPSYLREELQCDFRMAGLALLYTLQKKPALPRHIQSRRGRLSSHLPNQNSHHRPIFGDIAQEAFESKESRGVVSIDFWGGIGAVG